MQIDILNPGVINTLVKGDSLLSLSIKITHDYVSKVNYELSIHSLSIEQWIILSLVNSGNVQYASQLRRTMGLSAPRIARIIDEMEGSGHIKRQIELYDRRRLKLDVTDKGNAIYKKLSKKLSYNLHLNEFNLTNDEKIIYQQCLDSKLSAH